MDEEEVLWRAFQFFDRDGNGDISVSELESTMAELGGYLSAEELQRFVRLMDANNDGVIGVRCWRLQFGRQGAVGARGEVFGGLGGRGQWGQGWAGSGRRSGSMWSAAHSTA